MITSIFSKKDYALVSFIGFCVAFFMLPFLVNTLSGKWLPYLNNPAIIATLVIALVVFSNVGLYVVGKIAEKIIVFSQIGKFVAVGGFNTFLDWSIVNTLMIMTGVFDGTLFVVFNIISFLVATSASFFWNKYWTFESNNTDATKDYVQFMVVTGLGMLIKVGTAAIIVNVFGKYVGLPEGLWANVGLLLATMLSMIWNFVGYKFFVFKK